MQDISLLITEKYVYVVMTTVQKHYVAIIKVITVSEFWQLSFKSTY